MTWPGSARISSSTDATSTRPLSGMSEKMLTVFSMMTFSIVSSMRGWRFEQLPDEPRDRHVAFITKKGRALAKGGNVDACERPHSRLTHDRIGVGQGADGGIGPLRLA